MKKKSHPRFELIQNFVTSTEFIANNIKICISKEVYCENIFLSIYSTHYAS